MDTSEISGLGGSSQTTEGFEALCDNSDATLLREYGIGKLRVALVRAEDSGLERLRQNTADIQYIQSNAKINLWSTTVQDASTSSGYYPDTTEYHPEFECLEQKFGHDIGSLYWGLTRISHRQRPDYSAGGYMYTSGDRGRGVDIYVIDSGIQVNHSEFENRAIWGYTSESFRDGEGDADLDGHGTFVASLAAGKTVGVAKEAAVIAVKTLGTDGGLVSDFLEGLEWVLNRTEAEQKLDQSVINLSLGAAGDIPVLNDAVAEAAGQGVVVIVAAGNSGADACEYSPARVTAAITVGSTNSSDELAIFSNYGDCVDILAPGYDVLGASIGDPGYTIGSGTSFSAPYVAGAVARYLSSHQSRQGTITPFEHIVSTASRCRVRIPSYAEDTPNLLLYKACNCCSYDKCVPDIEDDGGAHRSTALWSVHLFSIHLMILICYGRFI